MRTITTRSPTRRRLPVVAGASVMVAALVTMVAGTAQSGVRAAAATPTPCVTTRLIGVHGTGEETGIIGTELSALYNSVANHTGIAEQGLNGWSDYNFVSALEEALAVGGVPLLLADLPAILQNLRSRIAEGASSLYRQIEEEAAACPGERFIVAGFSQGAAVVGDFVHAHPELAGRPVSGVILWADPTFNGNDPMSHGYNSTSGARGSAAGWHGDLGARPAFPTAWAGRLDSYCTSLDPVCHWQTGSPAALVGDVAHLGHHGEENHPNLPVLPASSRSVEEWAPSVWDQSGGPAFYDKWRSYDAHLDPIDGAAGLLGQPTADAAATPGGERQTFAGSNCGSGSAILWSAASGTHEMHGCIYHRYEEIGEDSSGIGLPTTDEYRVSGGVQQSFSNGNIRDIGGAITVTVYPHSYALDNTDPYRTSCAGAHPETTVAHTNDGPTMIDLQWSAYCATNWTRVIPNFGNGGPAINMDIWVERFEANGRITRGDVFGFHPDGAQPAWSDQLYAPVLSARACENWWNISTKEWSTPVCTAWV